eukprot:TRINITY_DN8794_c0_g1_i1.p1 TRINITY_DN8794_c0_g1~~TRINITY_DN8794_c0_g1_i1.p1  ORF type:complete len:333 (+),score=117.39 TRINITY_DN8794_c0_g1_i1:85-1083(+)
MNPLLLIGGYLVTMCCVVVAFLYWRRSKTSATPAPVENERQDNHQTLQERLRARLHQAANRNAAVDVKERTGDANEAGNNDQKEEQEPGEEKEDEEKEDEMEKLQNLAAMGKLSRNDRKKLAKAEKKQQTEAYRQAMQEADKSRQEKEDKMVAESRRREEEYERKEREKEEQDRKRKEEQQKKEEEEFDQWKDLITVDSAGTEEAQATVESQSLLEEFIDFIKKNKVVMLDDLASEFKIQTADCAKRIEELEKSGLITGVLDERGKFIYISPQEFEQLAKWIERRGRVTLPDVVAQANKIIDLTPTPISNASTSSSSSAPSSSSSSSIASSS